MKSNYYSRKRTKVNTVNEKCVNWRWAIAKSSVLINLSYCPFRIRATTPVLVSVNVVIHLKKTLTKSSKIRFVTYFVRGNYLKTAVVTLSHSYRNHKIKLQMLTITVNIFENIDTKFHNDQRKTIGDKYIHFRGT